MEAKTTIVLIQVSRPNFIPKKNHVNSRMVKSELVSSSRIMTIETSKGRK